MGCSVRRLSALQRSSGSAPVQFVLITVPLLFTMLLGVRVVWLGYAKAQLVAISQRIAWEAALADTTTQDAIVYGNEQCRSWLGACDSIEVSLGEVVSATVSAQGMEVSAYASSETG